MKRTVILSTNNNPNYLNYVPYVQKAWNKLGWNTLTFTFGTTVSTQDPINNMIDMTFSTPGYRSETIVQCARLLGHRFTDGLLMTSDIDMMPCSDYWCPNENKVTVYGFDLTERSQYPICYIAMKSENWDKVIPEMSLIELLSKFPNAKSDNWNKWWSIDQQIITQRINELVPNELLDLNDRGFTRSKGFNAKLAKGRIDRHNWDTTFHNLDAKIDAHMPRPFNRKEAEKVLKLLK